MIEIDFWERGGIKIVVMDGELNSETAADVHDSIVEHVQASDQVILDMTAVSYMSSAGIRTLLLLYRMINNGGGHVVLVGLSETLEDTLAITGFLEFFNTQKTLEAGIRTLEQLAT